MIFLKDKEMSKIRLKVIWIQNLFQFLGIYSVDSTDS